MVRRVGTAPSMVSANIADRIASAGNTTPTMSVRCRAVPGVRGTSAAASTNSSAPIGTFNRKAPRHEKMLANRLTARSRCGPYASATMPAADGTKAPPPMAWTARREMSSPMLSASPQHSEATVKVTTAARNTVRRPY